MAKPPNNPEVWLSFHELAEFLSEAYLGETSAKIEIPPVVQKEKGNRSYDVEIK